MAHACAAHGCHGATPYQPSPFRDSNSFRQPDRVDTRAVEPVRSGLVVGCEVRFVGSAGTWCGFVRADPPEEEPAVCVARPKKHGITHHQPREGHNKKKTSLARVPALPSTD